MKKYFTLLILISAIAHSQIIYQENFNSYTLSTYTTLYTSTQYTNVGNGFVVINDGLKNNKGSALHPNAPFHTDSIKNNGWGILYNPTLQDTFMVATSWLDTTATSHRWVVLPTISGISLNSVLHWDAMSPDPNYADGYAVYITTNTSAPVDTSLFTNTNKVFSIADNNTAGLGEKSQWTRRSVSLAAYMGQSIRIAFKENSKNRYQLWIDNITVENLSNTNDAAIQNNGNIKYVLKNTPFTLKARISNQGYNSITNINLAYSVQGVTSNNQSFALTSTLSPLNSVDVAFTNTLSVPSSGMYLVKIYVNQVNGAVDNNHFNDTISYYLTALNSAPPKLILLEQTTDVSYDVAPSVQDTLKSIFSSDTSLIVVQMHTHDSLATPLTNTLMKNFNTLNNKPIALLNRTYNGAINRNYFFNNEIRTYLQSEKTKITPCSVYCSNFNVDTNARTIQANVNTYFYENAKGDYRVNVYLIENNVYGNPLDTTFNQFNQLSAYYFTPYSAYYHQGYYLNSFGTFLLNAYQYKHQFTLEQSTNGIYGDASVIPNIGNTAGNTYTKTFTMNIPMTIGSQQKNRFRNLYLVAFVYEHDTLIENRKILNAILYKVTSNSEVIAVHQFSNKHISQIFPNPASQQFFIHTSYNMREINIFNMLGQEVYHQSSNSDIESVNVSEWAAGLYVIKISGENIIETKKLLIEK